MVKLPGRESAEEVEAPAAPKNETEGEREPVAPYTAEHDLSPEARLAKALRLLDMGKVFEARVEILASLEQKPSNALARNLLNQIDTPASEYFPSEYRVIPLERGESLSELASNYLADFYKFHALAKYNSIAAPRSARAGQLIKIPLTPSAIQAFSDQDAVAATADVEIEAPDAEPATSSGADPQLDTYQTSDATAEPESEESGASVAATDAEASVVPEVSESLADSGESQEANPSSELQSEPGTSTPAVVAEPMVTEPATPPPAPAVDTNELHLEALIAFKRQDLDRAIELWDQVLLIDPQHQDAQINRNQAVALKRRISEL